MAKRSERWAYWREVLRGHAASGLTGVAFCEAHGLSVTSLRRWRSKLRTELELEAVPAVVEVVLDEPAVLATPAAPPRDLELLVGGDLSLFFGHCAEPAYVAQLVVALRRSGAC